MRHQLKWTVDNEIRVGDTTFRAIHDVGGPAAGSLTVLKDRQLIETLETIVGITQPRRILEIGCFLGGSAAMLATACPGATVVGVDLRPTPPTGLEEAVIDAGLDERLSFHWATDQTDRGALERLLRDDFSGEPLDLVIDDASHLARPTLATFDILFPRLRPGGLYVIEDWFSHDAWCSVVAAELTRSDEAARLRSIQGRLREATGRAENDDRPLSAIAADLALASGAHPEALASVSLNSRAIWVERGPADLDTAEFRLSDMCVDRSG